MNNKQEARIDLKNDLLSARGISVVFPVALVLLLTGFVFANVQRAERERVATVFERQTENVFNDLHENLKVYLEIVQSIESLYAASQEVSRAEFNAFVARDLSQYPGIQALEWLPRVAHDQRVAFSEMARDEGLVDFEFKRWTPDSAWKTSGDKWADQYFTVYFTQPKGNEAALGRDLASNPAYRVALEHSRDSGEPVATTSMTLDMNNQADLLLFVPIYTNGAEVHTIYDRRHHLRGFAVGRFRLADMVQIGKSDLTDIGWRIIDEEGEQEQQLLFEDSTFALADSNSDYQTTFLHEFAGRKWQVQFVATPQYVATHRSQQARFVLSSGILLALLLGISLHIIIARAEKIDQLAKQLIESNQQLEAAHNQLAASNEALQESNQQLNTVFEATPNGMLIVRRDGTIIFVNSALQRLFGYSEAELIGQSVEILLPDSLRARHPEWRNTFFRQPQARPMGSGRDLSARNKNGHEFPVEIGLNPVEMEEEVCVLASVVDITERKRLEEVQKKLNEELAASNEALTQSNIQLQQFAYVASHDLQAPLRGIAGFAQFLQEEYHGQLDEIADEYIEYIISGVKRMQQLINDLLAYSRVQSQAMSFEPICLNDVFDDAVTWLRASIQETKSEVTRDELPTVLGDYSQLSQLLQNLIGNGIKYHHKLPPRVHLSAKKEGASFLISVRDNGIGIAPKHHEQIFNIFRRLHTEEEYSGTGIGLAICQRIVQRHGGRIWVESKAGAGATFYFTIPIIGHSINEQ